MWARVWPHSLHWSLWVSTSVSTEREARHGVGGGGWREGGGWMNRERMQLRKMAHLYLTSLSRVTLDPNITQNGLS